jgi:hypothetical protein
LIFTHALFKKVGLSLKTNHVHPCDVVAIGVRNVWMEWLWLYSFLVYIFFGMQRNAIKYTHI